jgi:hypothetical protein
MKTHGASHAMEITLAPGRCASAHLQRGNNRQATFFDEVHLKALT